MQISVQIGLNWNWPTGTELGKKSQHYFLFQNTASQLTLDVSCLFMSVLVLSGEGTPKDQELTFFLVASMYIYMLTKSINNYKHFKTIDQIISRSLL